MNKIIKYAGVVAALLILVLALYFYKPLPANPDSKALMVGANRYSVEIIRDNWGVPHIVGKRDADASFGLAYAHAEDDYQTIQELIAATRGVLASYRGTESAKTDYVVALMGVWEDLDRQYDKQVPEDIKAIAQGYADGLNLYAAHHLDATWQGLAPFTAKDVLAGFMFKTPFFYGLDKSLVTLFDETREANIALAPTAQTRAWSVTPAPQAELGSNAIAVAAHRSGDGKTRLLINSHQPLTGPVAWYEAHVVSAEGWDMTGGLFPGTPLILHGFNRHLGWGNTVNHIDLVDSYVLTRNPDNEMQYRLDDKWVDFEQREVQIDVKLFGPFHYLAKRQLLISEHGPVIEAGDNTVAIRYAGKGEVRQLEQYFRLNKSQNLDEFMQAMAMNALPSINYIYADKDNNIGFIHNAQYPARNDEWNWNTDLPGDRSELIWQGYRPFSQIPKLINPVSGMVFNANNTPFKATDGPDNLAADAFPQSMGLATNHTNRSLRLIELNDGQRKLGRAELLALKFDTRYSDKSEYVEIINKVLQLDGSDQPALSKAQTILRAWNRDTDIKNKHAALAIMILRHLKRSDNPQDYSEPALQEAVLASSNYLMHHFGQLDPEWGEVNRLVRGAADLPVSGGPDVLRAMYSYGYQPDETPKVTHGDSWIALVEWSPNGEQVADVVHQFGSATLDRASPHYADQAPLFVQQQWRRAVTDIDALRTTASRVYRPQELFKP